MPACKSKIRLIPILVAAVGAVLWPGCAVFERVAGVFQSHRSQVVFLIRDDRGPVQGARVVVGGREIQSVRAGIAWQELRRGEYAWSVSAPGHAPASGTLRLPGDRIEKQVRLARLESAWLERPNEAATIELGGNRQSDPGRIEPGAEAESPRGLTVKMPAGLFADRPRGTVQVDHKFLTGKSILEEMPGGFRGQDRSGRDVRIESHGAFYMRFMAGGKKLSFAPGKKIEVLIPAAVDKPTIPVWSLKDGRWREEGIARRVRPGLYSAKLSHLSWVNLDEAIEVESTILIKRFETDTGRKVDPQYLVAKGQDYNGFSEFTRTSAGHFCMPVKAGARASVQAEFFVPFNSPMTFQPLYKSNLRAPDRPADCNRNPTGGLVIERLVFASVKGRRLPSGPEECRLKEDGAPPPDTPYHREVIELKSGDRFWGLITRQRGDNLDVFTRGGMRILPARQVKSIYFCG